mgnify:CR=1 FL=1
MEELTEENLKELLTFANAAASLITTRKGALRVMPTREEIKNLSRMYKKGICCKTEEKNLCLTSCPAEVLMCML